MLRPEHLQKIDNFIDNLNIVKLFDRFKKEEDDPNMEAAKDAIKEYRKQCPPAKTFGDLYHPKSVEEYDSMYGDPDDGCFTDMSDYH